MLRLVLATLLLALASTARAETWPDRPIKIITAAGPGAALDTLTRKLAEALQKELGQPVIVDNRPGANQIIAATACANARPDGYTFCTTATEPYTNNVFLFRNLPYDPTNGFAPVAMLANQLAGIVVRKELGAETLQDVVAYSRAHPGKLNWGSYGIGSNSHLYLEAVRQETGWAVTHIPYRDVTNLTQGLLANDVQLAYAVLDDKIQRQIADGTLKLIAYAGTARSPLYPDVPTFEELGLESYRIRGWYGLLAPAGTPPAIVERVNRTAMEVMNSPDMKTILQALSVAPVAAHAPADMAANIRRNRDVVGSSLQRANVQAQ